MQILRPVVAQCYRGGRSIWNRQSRDFSSLPSNNNFTKSMGVKLVISGAVLSVWAGFDALASKRRKEMEKMLQDYETAKEIAAKEEKKLSMDFEANYLTGKFKLIPVYFDEKESKKVLLELKNNKLYPKF